MKQATLNKVMGDFFEVVQSITGKEPEIYNAASGSFEKKLPEAAVWEDCSESPKVVTVKAGRITVDSGGAKRSLFKGETMTIPAGIRHVLRADYQSVINYKYLTAAPI